MKAFAASLALTAIALSGCMAGSPGTETSLRMLTDAITSAPAATEPAEETAGAAEVSTDDADQDAASEAEVVSFDDDGQAFVATDEEAPVTEDDASASAGEATASDEAEIPAPPDVEAPLDRGESYAAPLEPAATEEPIAELKPTTIEARQPPLTESSASDVASTPELPAPAPGESTAMEPALPPAPPKFSAVEFDPPQRPQRLAQQPEEVQPPAPSSNAREGLAADADRINRTVCDVSLDIRPPTGAGGLPENLAAERLADQPTIDETFPSGQPADVFCSYTPWTICYRPLYFEDIPLERYGSNVGYLQTGLSGVKFFGSIAALPYKMTRRPPRTCQCSNGFSRCGDCPLPGYGNRRFQWDAALVETAIITGFVFILP